MKQKTGKTKDEILAFRVEILDSQWQEQDTGRTYHPAKGE